VFSTENEFELSKNIIWEGGEDEEEEEEERLGEKCLVELRDEFQPQKFVLNCLMFKLVVSEYNM